MLDPFGNHRPVVGPEWGGGQTIAPVQVANGIIGPSIADGYWLPDGIAPHFDGVFVDQLGISPNELAVFSGNCEPGDLRRIEGSKPTGTGMVEIDYRF